MQEGFEPGKTGYIVCSLKHADWISRIFCFNLTAANASPQKPEGTSLSPLSPKAAFAASAKPGQFMKKQQKKVLSTNLNISSQTQNIALLGILTALALVLSAVELLLPPIPMLPPGAKLGLSNIITMYTAGAIGLGPALCIAVVKGLFSGLMRGFTAMLMSMAGGVASTFVMWLLMKIKKNPFGFIGIAVGGALTHNAAQLLVAVFLTTPAVIYYIPWLIVFGVLTGILTGLVLRMVIPLLNQIS